MGLELLIESLIFMFAGQGSQYYRMGAPLFHENAIFRSTMMSLDEQVKSKIGCSIVNELYYSEKNADPFNRLLYTHPAIFMVEFSLARMLIESGIEPDAVLGSSLGEYAAAAVAGVCSARDALDAVMTQALEIEANCPEGGMLAILASGELYQEAFLLDNCELVSVNAERHFVVSGEKRKLAMIQRELEARQVHSVPLHVNYGFHSELVDPAASRCRLDLKNRDFHSPQTTFISGLTGGEISELPSHYLWEAVRQPIQFTKAVQWLERQGAHIYVDVGPAGTLSGFVRQQIRGESNSKIFSIMNHFQKDMANFERLAQWKRSFKGRRGEKMMLGLVFAGQGSQKKGMGEGLFERYPAYTAAADQILGYSIKELCLQDLEGCLSQTQYTQPALYVVNALMYKKHLEETGRTPDYVAGHSLGEYNALLAAEVFDFETGLKLVQRRGKLMSEIQGGGMAAVIGLNREKIESIIHSNGLNTIDIVNDNSPSQVVIAGPKSDIESVQTTFEASGASMYIVLRVSGAFHSRYMNEVKESFTHFLSQFQLKDPKIPVISNVHARPYQVQSIVETLGSQINHHVKWTESIRYLMGIGKMSFIEIGPGNVLTKLISAIEKQSEPLIVSRSEIHSQPKAYELEREASFFPESLGIQSSSTEGAQSARAMAAEKETLAASGTNASATALAVIEPNMQPQPKMTHRQTAGTTTTDSPAAEQRQIIASALGSASFKKDYGIKYAYVTGAMYREIASKELIVKMGKAGLMGYLGTGGRSVQEVEQSIRFIQSELDAGQAYGMNMLSNPNHPQKEEDMIDLYLRNGIRNIEAAAYISINSALVRFRAHGLFRDEKGRVGSNHRIMAKVSRPEVAEAFLQTAPERIVSKLLGEGKITAQQAAMLKDIPMADDICAEADSGGHTDHGVAFVLLPAMIRLRNEWMSRYASDKRWVRVGAGGGIGTPEAAAAAFILGADFILTGSINQCTVEAGTSNEVKDLLNEMDIQDTESAPAGDMFEIGARIQVLRKGLFFPARANKLYDLYRHYQSLDEIDEKLKKQLQERYFKRSFDEIYEEVKRTLRPEVIEKAERNTKSKMAVVFRWYFKYSAQLALNGDDQHKVDYQIHTGPALGDFNRWVKGTRLENWRKRHVDEIAEKIMEETAELLNQRFNQFTNH